MNVTRHAAITNAEVAIASDQALADLILHGSGGAAARLELRLRHQPVVREYAIVRIGYNADGEADTAVERAFASLLEHGSIPPGGVRASLLSHVEHHARSLRNVTHTKVRTGPGTGVDPSAEGLGRTPIVRAFQLLPPASQALLWYHDLELLGTEVVALFLGLDPARVSTTVHTARRELRTGWIRSQLSTSDLAEDCRVLTRELLADDSPISAGSTEHLGRCLRCVIVASEADRVHTRMRESVLGGLLGATGAQVYRLILQSPGAGRYSASDAIRSASARVNGAGNHLADSSSSSTSAWTAPI